MKCLNNKLKMKQNYHFLLFFLFLILNSFLINELISIEITRKPGNELAKLRKIYEKKFSLKFNLDLNKLKDKPIYWKGWVKYFHYTESRKMSKPKSFFQNNMFYRQRIKHKERNLRDKYGYLNIPSNVHYFAIIQKDKLNIISSRSDEIPNIVDTLNYEFIKPIPISNPMSGGINDLGNFPEGKCIKVTTNIPRKYQKDFNPNKKGYTEAWIICTDNTLDKVKILKYLIQLTVKIQQKSGLTYKTQKRKFKKKQTLRRMFSPKKSIKKRKNSENRELKDGYWILLQDWTQCTLKCGGGKRYQQWMCHPPENGGKPCMGSGIKVKDCNTKPCPNILSKKKKNKKGETVKYDGKGNKSITLKPIFRMIPFSTRPQQYIKCILKETDAMLILKNYKHNLPNKAFDTLPKVPVRIVMNNSTISAFQDEKYHNNIFTMTIKESIFLRDLKEKCCFFLRWRKSEYKICGFERDCAKKTNFVKNWERDYGLFKKECGIKREIFSFGGITPKIDKKTGKITLEAAQDTKTAIPGTFSSGVSGMSASGVYSSSSHVEYDSKGRIKPGSVSLPLTRTDKQDFKTTLMNLVKETRDRLLKKKSKNIEAKVADFEKETLKQKVRKTQSIALNAIKREMELEELVAKEEKAKEDQESQDLMKAIIMEKRKEECLNFAMKEKEKESEVKKEKAHAMTEIQRIKKEALKMLKKKRMQLKEKIVQMRRVAERKKAMLKFQLIKLRQRMAKKLVTSHHKGNMFLCPQGRDDPVKRNDYCEYHFTENYPKFLECKNDYDFCFLCCETEYGNLFPQKREECYKLCDKK